MLSKIIINDKIVDYKIISSCENEIIILLNGKEFRFELNKKSNAGISLKIEDKLISVNGIKDDLFLNDKRFILKKYQSNKASLSSLGQMVSPMPGKIIKIVSDVGTVVKSGDPILVMEAMKMEHTIKANKDGKVSKIIHSVGEQVIGGAELVVIE